MSRWEYAISLVPVLLFIIIYGVRGSTEVEWLFAATFQLIHAKGEQIRAEIKKGSE